MHNAQKEIVERIIEKEVVRVRLRFSFPTVGFAITTCASNHTYITPRDTRIVIHHTYQPIIFFVSFANRR